MLSFFYVSLLHPVSKLLFAKLVNQLCLKWSRKNNTRVNNVNQEYLFNTKSSSMIVMVNFSFKRKSVWTLALFVDAQLWRWQICHTKQDRKASFILFQREIIKLASVKQIWAYTSAFSPKEFLLIASFRYALSKASQRSASLCSPKGSRLNLTVPEQKKRNKGKKRKDHVPSKGS